MILPGGHDKPIRQYLESKTLHRQLGRFLPYTQRSSSTTTTGAANTDTDTNNTNDHNDSSTTTTTQPQKKVLGAICHGVLPLAFAKCPGSREREGNTLLGEYRLQTTTLPKWMEATAWVASQAWLMGSYYRTYIERGAWTCGDVSLFFLFFAFLSAALFRCFFSFVFSGFLAFWPLSWLLFGGGVCLPASACLSATRSFVGLGLLEYCYQVL